jgi:hypothetical protein
MNTKQKEYRWQHRSVEGWYFNKKIEKYYSKVSIRGKIYYLGWYDTWFLASEAYKTIKKLPITEDIANKIAETLAQFKVLNNID